MFPFYRLGDRDTLPGIHDEFFGLSETQNITSFFFSSICLILDLNAFT